MYQRPVVTLGVLTAGWCSGRKCELFWTSCTSSARYFDALLQSRQSTDVCMQIWTQSAQRPLQHNHEILLQQLLILRDCPVPGGHLSRDTSKTCRGIRGGRACNNEASPRGKQPSAWHAVHNPQAVCSSSCPHQVQQQITVILASTLRILVLWLMLHLSHAACTYALHYMRHKITIVTHA